MKKIPQSDKYWFTDFSKWQLCVVNMFSNKHDGVHMLDHQYNGCGCYHVKVPDVQYRHLLTIPDYDFINPDWWYEKYHRHDSNGLPILLTKEEYEKAFPNDIEFTSYMTLDEGIPEKEYNERISKVNKIYVKDVMIDIVRTVNKKLGTKYSIDHKKQMGKDGITYYTEAYIPLKGNKAIIWLNCD
jgi:hypothetical protein